MSVRASHSLPSDCSGAIYAGVPMTPWLAVSVASLCVLASPKSKTLMPDLIIMVIKSGIKVLDFGLARTQRDATLTASHGVMGTPAYMAPEQSEGKECDARTDIYALGLVLYEMATGSRAFDGDSWAALIAEIMR